MGGGGGGGGVLGERWKCMCWYVHVCVFIWVFVFVGSKEWGCVWERERESPCMRMRLYHCGCVRGRGLFLSSSRSPTVYPSLWREKDAINN
jgi:hypothetical protein